jgi:hypothetical protein
MNWVGDDEHELPASGEKQQPSCSGQGYNSDVVLQVIENQSPLEVIIHIDVQKTIGAVLSLSILQREDLAHRPIHAL